MAVDDGKGVGQIVGKLVAQCDQIFFSPVDGPLKSLDFLLNMFRRQMRPPCPARATTKHKGLA